MSRRVNAGVACRARGSGGWGGVLGVEKRLARTEFVVLRMDRDRSGAVRLTFVLPVDEPRGRVSVVGDFNGWQPGVHELRRRSNGTRSLAVTVSEGTALRFRYLAENGHWSNETEHPDVRQIGNDSLVVAAVPRKAVG